MLKTKIQRPPVVAVLGHVDHGKTTLLDHIRKSNVAAREHGGITQHIGAYQITLKDRKITFIDTPGHEAFAKMRSRGAVASDIAILVVAADDSVKPQTVESITQIKAAGVPIIVAINKIDLPGANVDKVKSDLAKVGVQVEGFGGDIPFTQLSAKTGKGIPELLDLILLVSEMNDLKSDSKAPFESVIIETKIDKGKGLVATLIVKQGSLAVGTPLFEGAKNIGRVRALINEKGERLDVLNPGDPAEVLGFSKLPSIGALVHESAQAEKQILQAQVPARDLAGFMAAMAEADKKKLTILLKADTAGSLEAIVASLPKDRVVIVRRDLGDITEADILDAKSSKAFVVGFNVKAAPSIEKLARTEKVVYRTYTIIYELLKELGDVVEGLEEILAPERELGIGQIIAEFPYENLRVAGTKVLSGRLARGDTVKIVRKEEEVARGKIKSMKKVKEEVNKVEEGADCGILFDKKVDFELGDAIIAVTI
ncbi:MAG: translation initiation factor IF-2 [uncultured bacterium]|uniref:Translation initiation factor IF-2 n=1 Tax=Candidatus Gottesmanbacteria bacterium RIFCSPLOWO2_01_FULL_43_11b TaxID=1798392 RepID=A0A1F6AHK5_9BACT|nr:MAG: translation initiation factor IF-2 [uncultured bacterium]OGG24220.1 MAG: translation initiation factor IF-2 [Candidatus Gottesmanbacteria bacterium RIFCSPLOWO2_01_FULL_43_11b]